MVNLRKLKLNGVSISSVPDLARSMQTPNLVSLIIETIWGPLNEEVPSDLEGSLSTGSYATACPLITLYCVQMTVPKDKEQAFDSIHSKLLKALPVLRASGRLQIVSGDADI